MGPLYALSNFVPLASDLAFSTLTRLSMPFGVRNCRNLDYFISVPTGESVALHLTSVE